MRADFSCACAQTNQVKVHFLGWGPKWDEYIAVQPILSKRIAAAGSKSAAAQKAASPPKALGEAQTAAEETLSPDPSLVAMAEAIASQLQAVAATAEEGEAPPAYEDEGEDVGEVAAVLQTVVQAVASGLP